MMKDGTFVDHIFLCGLADVLMCDIIVIPVYPETSSNGLFTVIKGGGLNSDVPGENLPIFLGLFEETKFRVPHYQSVIPTRDSEILREILRYGGRDVARELNLPSEAGKYVY